MTTAADGRRRLAMSRVLRDTQQRLDDPHPRGWHWMRPEERPPQLFRVGPPGATPRPRNPGPRFAGTDLFVCGLVNDDNSEWWVVLDLNGMVHVNPSFAPLVSRAPLHVVEALRRPAAAQGPTQTVRATKEASSDGHG